MCSSTDLNRQEAPQVFKEQKLFYFPQLSVSASLITLKIPGINIPQTQNTEEMGVHSIFKSSTVLNKAWITNRKHKKRIVFTSNIYVRFN